MTNPPISSSLTHLECPECRRVFDAQQIHNYCTDCQSPLLACYDLEKAKITLNRESLALRPRGLWRWAELLPVADSACRLDLGQGDTPLVEVPGLGAEEGIENLFVKDESLNATGSFKARGLCMAVSKAIELGIEEFVIPTAGNAGGALAAYCARAGKQAHIYMPADTPAPIQAEVRMYGADLHLVAGLINDAGRKAAADAQGMGWFDVSTFKEPYRAEGKKTMGLELAESFGWQLPEVIVYPTGGGTGLVGMWKAFDELEHLGWIDHHRPRMISVQSAGCAPVVRAFDQNAERVTLWENAQTVALGLRVPTAFAGRLILSAIRESKGAALRVSDDQITAAQKRLARAGFFGSPEGAAALAALPALRERGLIQPGDRVVLFNTGSGLKYL